MKKLIFTIIILVISLPSYSQHSENDMIKGVSSKCGTTIIKPLLSNIVKLSNMTFANFEVVMKKSHYKYSSKDNDYVSFDSAGCGFNTIAKNYKVVKFYWANENKITNDLYDELEANKITLTKNDYGWLEATFTMSGKTFRIYVSDSSDGSGALTLFEQSNS